MKDKTVARAFGRVLYDARRMRGLTQEDLAAEAEVDRTYPSLMERGHRVPTLAVFFRLCRALQHSPADLITATFEHLVAISALSPPPGLPREEQPPCRSAACAP